MSDVEIRNRPFACHALGLMMPDGIFDTALGVQELNAQVTSTAGAPLDPSSRVYLEAVSDPSIAVTPLTHDLGGLPPNATTTVSWRVDMTNASPGSHRVSFVTFGSAGTSRIIKKIFLSRTSHHPASDTFTVEFPQGRLDVQFVRMFGPAQNRCCPPQRDPGKERDEFGKPRHVIREGDENGESFLDIARDLAHQHVSAFTFCRSEYLPEEVRMTFTPNPSYDGQYSDLPFDDPWWKVVLCVLAVVALVAAAIVEATAGSGSVGVGVGGGGGTTGSCCGVSATGGGTSLAAAGLVAAAAALATAAALSDERDVMRRGQDQTDPGPTAMTIAETVISRFKPTDAIVPGTPFEVGVDWTYQRFTDGGAAPLEHSAQDEINANVHVLTRYQIDAPDVVRTYARETWIVKASFWDAEEQLMRGDQLFVQCFMFAPNGDLVRIQMSDDGIRPNDEASDGIYTGQFDFWGGELPGLWTYVVIAQDVNHAQEDMDPEDAAKIIGGMLLTPQVTIGFNGGDCPLVPDGHVNVI